MRRSPVGLYSATFARAQGFLQPLADRVRVNHGQVYKHGRDFQLLIDIKSDGVPTYAGYDGRLGDLQSGMPASLMPLVSDNWSSNFTWRGVGPMPAAEKTKLHDIVTAAHDAGYKVRFWETPDTPGAAREAVWTELSAAHVDYLNTDDLHGLEDFLRG